MAHKYATSTAIFSAVSAIYFRMAKNATYDNNIIRRIPNDIANNANHANNAENSENANNANDAKNAENATNATFSILEPSK